MKGFIEVTLPMTPHKAIVNIAHIFAIEPYLNKDRTCHCEIRITHKGYNDYPFQYYRVTETYEQVAELIKNAL